MNLSTSLTLDPFTNPPKTIKLPLLQSLRAWSSLGRRLLAASYKKTHVCNRHSNFEILSASAWRGCTYSKVDGLPRACSCVEDENFWIAVLSLKTSIEKDFFSSHNKCSVMRDGSWTSARSVNLLPFNSVVRVLEQLLDSSKIDLPHGGDRSLFQVTTSVHIQTIWQKKRQPLANNILYVRESKFEIWTYYSPSFIVKMKAQWLERLSGSLPERRTSIHESVCTTKSMWWVTRT